VPCCSSWGSSSGCGLAGEILLGAGAVTAGIEPANPPQAPSWLVIASALLVAFVLWLLVSGSGSIPESGDETPTAAKRGPGRPRKFSKGSSEAKAHMDALRAKKGKKEPAPSE